MPNSHERYVRNKAMNVFLRCYRKKRDVLYGMVNLLVHLIPYFATYLQETYFDEVWNKIQALHGDE